MVRGSGQRCGVWREQTGAAGSLRTRAGPRRARSSRPAEATVGVWPEAGTDVWARSATDAWGIGD